MTTVRIDQGELRPLLTRLAAFFEARGVEAYVTGGFLRDRLAGRPVNDVDITVAGDPLLLGPALGDELGGTYFPLQEERGHARVKLPDSRLFVDLIPFRGEDIEADLRARDYTINALGGRLSEVAGGECGLIDSTGGLADLEARIVRMTSEQAFTSDPLRLLRGPRLATNLGFAIEPATEAAIRRHAALVTSAAPERQRDELMLLFAMDRAADALRRLDDLGLLSPLLPELDATRGVDQPPDYHAYDVFGHSIASVEAFDWLMAEVPPNASPGRELWELLWPRMEFTTALREYFAEDLAENHARATLMKFCALLHDIGKPQTRSIEANGRVRFFGHSEAGADIARGIMRRLRFSSREISIAGHVIEAHLRPLQMQQNNPPTRRAIYKLFRDTGEAGIETLFITLADHLGSVGPRVTLEGFRAHVDLIRHLLYVRFASPEVVSPPKIISGEDVMSEFGLEPGALVGELLEAVREAQAGAEVSTREQALELARAKLAELRAAAPQ